MKKSRFYILIIAIIFINLIIIFFNIFYSSNRVSLMVPMIIMIVLQLIVTVLGNNFNKNDLIPFRNCISRFG